MASSSLPFPSLLLQKVPLQRSSKPYSPRLILRPITASVTDKPSVSAVAPPPESTELPIREIPGDYGPPFIGPIRDRLDFFYNQGPAEFFKSRIQKYQSTVLRANMPPGPFISSNSNVVVLLDGKSFPVLFDLNKVEKKNLFTGTYMPSTDLTGGYRILSYLDPAEPNHGKLKQLLFFLLKFRRDKVIPEFHASYTELFEKLESEIASSGKSSFTEANNQTAFNFLARSLYGSNPADTELGADGPNLITKWVLFNLHPILTLGLPKLVEELLIRTFPLPPFLVQNDYNKLYEFFYNSSESMLKEAEKMGIPKEEACHNLVFATCFNSYGGMKILFPNIIKSIGQAGAKLQAELAEEIRSAIRSNGGKVTMAAMEQMPLMKSTVYESLRMEPPAATAQAIDGHDESDLITSTAADELKLITDAVRALPEHAVEELLSIGVCVRCIFRIFCVHERLYSCALLSPSLLDSILGNATKLEGDPMVSGSQAVNDSSSLHSSPGILIDVDICRICLGILQFLFYDQQDVLVKRECASDFASTIADVIKLDGHIIDNFSLEVSLPQFIMENEKSVWSHIKKKYHSELWYQKIVRSELISIKDVLKLSLTNPLETLLGVKSGMSSFQIRLTYTHLNASMNVQNIAEKNQCSKRRKTGADDEVISNYRLFSCDIDGSNLCSNERYESTKSSSNGLQDHGMTDCHSEKVNQPCHLAFLCCRTPTYIGGRYLKFSRNVSQTRWIIDDERMGDASVEEIISGNILPMCRGDIYKFHAAGREDIDVRMLGSGRPFLIEIQNARRVPSDASIKEIERKINSLENKLVMVKNLKVLGSEAWTLMREGEAEKQKQYAALVWISRSLNDDDSRTISSLKDLQILQRTPVRVLHRRSPLEREKIIHWMKIERIAASSQYFLLHLCTQAGTYIKEFVHGDLGRTHPSIGSILGCRAEILQLDVTDVKMDCFLADGI